MGHSNILDFILLPSALGPPAYSCFRSLYSGNDDTVRIRHWVSYFVVISLFLVFQSFFDFFLGWFPLYPIIRLVGIVAFQNPILAYPDTFLTRYLFPFYTDHQNEIHAFISYLKSVLTSLFQLFFAIFSKSIKRNPNDLARKLSFLSFLSKSKPLPTLPSSDQVKTAPCTPQKSDVVDDNEPSAPSLRDSTPQSSSDGNLSTESKNRMARTKTPRYVLPPSNELDRSKRNETPWRRFLSDDGRYFYYNKITKERVWYEPESWVNSKVLDSTQKRVRKSKANFKRKL